MSRPEMKKRHAKNVNTSIMGAFTTLSTEARTVTWHQIPEWQRDNKYILSGYRQAKANYLEILASLTFLHNETCNVYTHLVGALLLPLIAVAFMRVLSEPQFLNVSETDYAMFGIYFLCAECCLVLSATFHLLAAHSHDVDQFWHRMDLLGIVIVIVGTFVPGIHYIFSCDPGLQKLHWGIVSPSDHSPSRSHDMLTSILDHSFWLHHRWSNFNTGAHNASLAECEGGLFRCARCIGVHSFAAWGSAIRARVHASVLGYEVVHARANSLWCRS